MHKTKIIQKDYSLSSMNYQLKLPFELEVLLSSNRWQLPFRFIFLLKQSFFLASNIQPCKAGVFFLLVSFHPIQPHALLPDIDIPFRLSLAPSLTSGSRRIILLLFLLQIPVFSDVLSLHTAFPLHFFASIFARWFPPRRLQLLCPCFIRFAITLHTWFSIVPMFRYSSPSGGSGSSRFWD